MKIERAAPRDAEKLTALAMRSKNYWNYGDALIESWRNELTILPSHIRIKDTYKGLVVN